MALLHERVCKSDRGGGGVVCVDDWPAALTKKFHRLNRLAEAHFVGENRIDALRPAMSKPIDAFELILVQFAARFVDVRRLSVVLLAYVCLRHFVLLAILFLLVKRMLAARRSIRIDALYDALRNRFIVHALSMRPIFCDRLIEARNVDLVALPSRLLVWKLAPLDEIVELCFCIGRVVDNSLNLQNTELVSTS